MIHYVFSTLFVNTVTIQAGEVVSLFHTDSWLGWWQPFTTPLMTGQFGSPSNPFSSKYRMKYILHHVFSNLSRFGDISCSRNTIKVYIFISSFWQLVCLHLKPHHLVSYQFATVTECCVLVNMQLNYLNIQLTYSTLLSIHPPQKNNYYSNVTFIGKHSIEMHQITMPANGRVTVKPNSCPPV